MKRILLRFTLLFALSGFLLASPSCTSKKIGCPTSENATTKAGKDGKMPTKRGKSSLFPKGMGRK